MDLFAPAPWFDFRGRADRREFLARLAILFVIGLGAHTIAAWAVGRFGTWVPRVSLLTLISVGGLAAWAVIFRRLHDLGVRGLPILFASLLAASVGGAIRNHSALVATTEDGVWIIGMLLLASLPARRGENRFDAPKKPRRPPKPTAEEVERVRELREALVRPALRLTSADEPGFSKLGGAPELPPELAWPVGADGPLAFVTQMDLAEARAAGGPDWLPDEGAIYVFYDDDRFGFPDFVKLLFGPRGEVERAPPLSPEREFGERRVGFLATRLKPSVDWLDLGPAFYGVFEDEVDDAEPDHRLGGYPSEIQWECLPATAERLAREAGWTSAATAPFDPATTEWRLLLQIGHDDELGMEWLDAGAIYILVREEDARAGDFSKTVAILHMH